jgi:hypothetical protein
LQGFPSLLGFAFVDQTQAPPQPRISQRAVQSDRLIEVSQRVVDFVLSARKKSLQSESLGVARRDL